MSFEPAWARASKAASAVSASTASPREPSAAAIAASNPSSTLTCSATRPRTALEIGGHEGARAVPSGRRRARRALLRAASEIALALGGMQVSRRALEFGLYRGDGFLGGLVAAVQRTVALVAGGSLRLERHEFGAGRIPPLPRPARARSAAAGVHRARRPGFEVGNLDPGREARLFQIVARDERGLLGKLLVECAERCPRRRGLSGDDPAARVPRPPRHPRSGAPPRRGLPARRPARRPTRRRVRPPAEPSRARRWFASVKRLRSCSWADSRPNAVLRAASTASPACACSMRVSCSLFWSSCSCSTIRSVLRSASLRLKSDSDVREFDDLVGEQASPGVAGDGGDGCGLTGDFRLLPQRLEPAPHLGRDIGEAHQVRFERLELADPPSPSGGGTSGCRRPPR